MSKPVAAVIATFLCMQSVPGLESSARADLMVNVGNHTLLPNTPGQTIDLYVSGGSAVSGFLLAMQIGDGVGGPRGTDVDLESGIFTGQNPQSDLGSTDWLKFYDISTLSSPIIADGLLLQLTVSTVGVPMGNYDLRLSGIAVPDMGTFDSMFLDASAAPVATTFNAGTLAVVPEPAGLLLLGLVAPLLLRQRRPVPVG